MVSSSKILTVSYGTFSCTLEGFDDSFDTMKAIAEYFRDLAQDDRYFGAEPPTPDAEMLARIAEREIARRVEARVEGSSVRLRSIGHDAQTAARAAEEGQSAARRDLAASVAASAAVTGASDAEAPTRPAPDAAPAAAQAPDTGVAQPADPVASAALADRIARDAPLTGPAATDMAATDSTAAASASRLPQRPMPGGIAEKLQRIRDVVASGTARPDSGGTTPGAAPATHGGTAAGGAPADAEAPESIDVGAPELLVADDELIAAAAALAEDDGDDARSEPPAPQADAADAFRAAAWGDDAEAPALPGSDESGSDTVAPRLEAEDAPEDECALAAALAGAEPADMSDEVDEVDSHAGGAAASDDAVPAPDAADAGAEAAGADGIAEAAESRPRAVKVKRDVFDAAVASGAFAPVEPGDAGDDGAANADSSLSDADEAELARELASLEAELAGIAPEEGSGPAAAPDDAAPAEDAPASAGDSFAEEVAAAFEGSGEAAFAESDEAEGAGAATEPEADSFEAQDSADTFDPDDYDDDEATEAARRAVKMASPARAMLTENRIAEDDGSVSRLMTETDREFREPEGNRRRSAIAHLRAAVAATRADRLLGRRRSETEETEPYREDLADVVRPRRPKPSEARRPAERPAPSRPAPLKLVAEQRVGAEPAAAAEPVRPRRVAREAEAPSEAGGPGFVAFARSVGAVDLPDLLEAAAAYLAFVEERPQFTRPQLMGKLREAETSESSREDRLRSFGQLLREGKIAKIEGGRFTASDRIAYRSEARAAG
ncbi:hypothetical protein [Roseivivax sp. CAU 1761]